MIIRFWVHTNASVQEARELRLNAFFVMIRIKFNKIAGVSNMQYSTKQIFPIVLIILSLIIGCDRDTTDAENMEILIIGPYKTTCSELVDQECFLKFNGETEQWGLLYANIQGFEYQPGYIYRLEVHVIEQDEMFQNVEGYTYQFIRVLIREEASADKRPPRKPYTLW